MGCQRQLPVYDNTEVSCGVRNSDVSAEHQDVVAVDPVHELTLAEPLQLLVQLIQNKPEI